MRCERSRLSRVRFIMSFIEWIQRCVSKQSHHHHHAEKLSCGRAALSLVWRKFIVHGKFAIIISSVYCRNHLLIVCERRRCFVSHTRIFFMNGAEAARASEWESPIKTNDEDKWMKMKEKSTGEKFVFPTASFSSSLSITSLLNEKKTVWRLVSLCSREGHQKSPWKK